MAWCEAGNAPHRFWKETPRTVFAAIRGYHRRRGWLAWHIGYLSRVTEFPPLHELTGHDAPPEETDEEREARIYRNSMAWVIVTGGEGAPTAQDFEDQA